MKLLCPKCGRDYIYQRKIKGHPGWWECVCGKQFEKKKEIQRAANSKKKKTCENISPTIC